MNREATEFFSNHKAGQGRPPNGAYFVYDWKDKRFAGEILYPG